MKKSLLFKNIKKLNFFKLISYSIKTNLLFKIKYYFKRMIINIRIQRDKYILLY